MLLLFCCQRNRWSTKILACWDNSPVAIVLSPPVTLSSAMQGCPSLSKKSMSALKGVVKPSLPSRLRTFYIGLPRVRITESDGTQWHSAGYAFPYILWLPGVPPHWMSITVGIQPVLYFKKPGTSHRQTGQKVTTVPNEPTNSMISYIALVTYIRKKWIFH